MSDKELLELIKNDYYRINPKGCLEYMKKRDKRIPCLPILQKRFENKTFNEILIMAGVNDDDLNFVRRNKEQYLNKLQQVINELGYIPSQNMFAKLGYSHSMIIKLCGSWENAIKELGYESYKCQKITKVEHTKEELLEQYINLCNKLGRIATYNDIENSNETYNVNVYSIRFGGLNNLRKEAGFDTLNSFKGLYTKEDILSELLEKRIELKRKLTSTDIKTDSNLPSFATILRYFETTKITEVIDAIEDIMSKQI